MQNSIVMRGKMTCDTPVVVVEVGGCVVTVAILQQGCMLVLQSSRRSHMGARGVQLNHDRYVFGVSDGDVFAVRNV